MSDRRQGPHYHVGIVVPDISEARATLSEQLGVRWGPVLHLDAVEYRDGAGHDVVLPTTMCYSVDAPHLELVQEVAGSIWVRNEHSNLHHIGLLERRPGRRRVRADRCRVPTATVRPERR